jgi:hypothetical protein
MRFVASIVGIVMSVLPLIFFWVGAQTFVRPLERGLAYGMVIGTGSLLALSIALLFTPFVQRIQFILLVATIAAVAIILTADRLFK